jgi:F0F1-type ATP synthase beta subunit
MRPAKGASWAGTGVAVSAAEALRTCQGILDGQHDDVPAQLFYVSGGISEMK